jgi:hypothetical protein
MGYQGNVARRTYWVYHSVFVSTWYVDLPAKYILQHVNGSSLQDIENVILWSLIAHQFVV